MVDITSSLQSLQKGGSPALLSTAPSLRSDSPRLGGGLRCPPSEATYLRYVITFTCSGVLFEFALTALVFCFTFTFTSVASTATTDDKQDAEARVGGSTQIIRV